MRYGIIHLKNAGRFEKNVEGHTAVVEYVVRSGNLDIIRTYVPKPIKGRGIADELVSAAYAYADEHNLGRKATCPYAAAWLERHLA